MNAPVSLENASVLVTGASGFIGGHVVQSLLDKKCKVHCLVRRSSDLLWLDRTRVKLHYGDLTDPLSLENCLGQIDFVFHCAGLTQAKSRKEYFRINADACQHLYEKCSQAGKHLKRIVHLSSLAAVGPALPNTPVNEATPCKPVTFYGKSKLAGEKIAGQFAASLPITILRPPVVYGPRETNFFTFLKGIAKGWNVKMGSSERVLSLIYVQDLVDAMLKAAVCPADSGNAYFVTDGNLYPWDSLVQTASRLLNVQPRTIPIPDSMLVFLGLFLEFVAIYRTKPALLDSQRMIDIRQSTWTASSQKFFDDCKFAPQYDLQKGLEETLNWYKEHQWL